MSAIWNELWKSFIKSSTTCEDALHKTDVESGLGALFSIFQYDLNFMWVGDVTALKVTSWDAWCWVKVFVEAHTWKQGTPVQGDIQYEKYIHKHHHHRTNEVCSSCLQSPFLNVSYERVCLCKRSFIGKGFLLWNICMLCR